MENGEKLKATILLMHYPGEKMWTAMVPSVEGCLAEGETPELATDNIKEELQIITNKYPEVKDKLKEQPQYLITEVEL
jgi:predicted RNase H-like HicB family nuclease